jgi:hypothetical protein
MIVSITPQGPLIRECGLDGERKRENVFPAHPAGIQVSRDRWLLFCATRTLRQHDDDHSIVYQLRADAPDGRLLREGFLQRTRSDWDPFGDGSACVCLLRHAMGFGVPKGAVLNGRPAPNANVFAAVWSRSAAGRLDPRTGLYAIDPGLETRTIEAVWCQFRLNDAEDDIEILQPPRKLRQKGYENGPSFCSHETASFMVASLVPAVAFNAECTEWAATQEMSVGIAALKYRFNAAAGLYEWVETGPAQASTAEFSLREPTLARVKDDWIVGVRPRWIAPTATADWYGSLARDRGHTGWIKVENPFREMPFPAIVRDPHREAPMTIHHCADGVLRLFSGDLANSPYKARRDPLYCWDVNTDDFSVSNRHVLFDTVKAGVFPDDPKLQRSTCFGFVFPHAGGDTQLVAHRVMCFRYLPGMDAGNPPITAEQLDRFGVYYERLQYTEEYPPAWRFAP